MIRLAIISARRLVLRLTPLFYVVGGFANNNYWSSTENDNNNAWKQNFNNGNQNNNNKNNTNYVRAVRGFKQSRQAPEVYFGRFYLKHYATIVIF